MPYFARLIIISHEKSWKMCCRYKIEEGRDADEVDTKFSLSPLLEKWQGKATIAPVGEIYPSYVVPVLAPNKKGIPTIFPMKWGYQGNPILINARGETANAKPTFAESFRYRRCLIPCSCYYEWPTGRERGKGRYRLSPAGTAFFYLCGLYRYEEGMPVFVVLTKQASEGIRFIHSRMPLILPPSFHAAWLDPSLDASSLIEEAISELDFVFLEKEVA